MGEKTGSALSDYRSVLVLDNGFHSVDANASETPDSLSATKITMNLSPTATITVPLQITISVGAPQPAPRAPQMETDISTAFASVRANETSIYYDAEQDALNRATYYGNINWVWTRISGTNFGKRR